MEDSWFLFIQSVLSLLDIILLGFSDNKKTLTLEMLGEARGKQF